MCLSIQKVRYIFDAILYVAHLEALVYLLCIFNFGMQEISLFSGISSHRREEVIQLLERLTGRRQHQFKDWHLVYAPPGRMK